MRLTTFCYICILAMVGFPTMAQNDVENVQISNDDIQYISDLVASPDGGFYVTGESFTNSNVTDIAVTKYNSDFSVAWQKWYGGSDEDFISKLVVHPTGLYLVCRSFSPISGNKTVPPKGPSSHIWLLKLNFDGDIEWQKSYGGLDGANSFQDLSILSPDTLVLSSWSSASNTGDKTHPLTGISDGWVLFLSPDGDIYYDKVYTGSRREFILNTSIGENRIYHDGTSNSFVSDTNEFGTYPSENWIVATDRKGEPLWNKTIRHSGTSYVETKLIEKNNTLYFAISDRDQINENEIRTAPFKGREDVWLIKMNLDGEIIDQYSYGGSDKERVHDMKFIDEDRILLGISSSSPPSLDKTTPLYGEVNTNEFTNPPGNYFDYWAVIIDTNGNIQHQITFGGKRNDYLEHILVYDDYFVLAGMSRSDTSGNKTTAGFGAQWEALETWIVIIDKDQLLNTKDFTTHISHVSIFPNPTTDFITIQAEEPLQSLALFDVNGKQVHQENYTNQSQTDIKVSMQHLPSGTYFLNYRTNSFQASKMVVKQ